jgi:hypothetical protein
MLFINLILLVNSNLYFTLGGFERRGCDEQTNIKAVAGEMERNGFFSNCSKNNKCASLQNSKLIVNT